MVALVASLGALALLGLVTHVPKWLGDDRGFQTVTPGLLTVEADAKGVATLGGGVTVSLYTDGMRVVRGDSLLFQSVIGGSLLSAVEGRTTGTGSSTHEHVDRRFDNMRVESLVFLPGRATYVGELFDSHGSLPFTLRIELAGGVVKIGVNVNGADGVVWHLDHRPLTTGLPPGLPHVNLRGSARWLRPTTLEGQAAFTSNLGTDVGLGPQRVPRGVDVRAPGRTDVHIWSDATFLSVSSQSHAEGTG
ncbi:hypothetical protein GCM10027517_19440 [Phycicoccus ginsengisoli]